MHISHKNNVIQQVHETEWQCKRLTKGLSKLEYGEWINTVTTTDSEGRKTVDYSGETGYTIVECTDEDVQARLAQLDNFISNKPEGTTYNIKYYASKRDAEEILDSEGKSHDPKQYVSSHFVPDTLSTAMKKYRQDLRDVPNQSDPDDITWPTKP